MLIKWFFVIVNIRIDFGLDLLKGVCVYCWWLDWWQDLLGVFNYLVFLNDVVSYVK